MRFSPEFPREEFHVQSDVRLKDVDTTSVLIKRNDAVDQRIDRVIVAESDALAGSPAGSALTNDDAAGLNRLTAVNLNAAALSVRVATIAAGTLTFLMSPCTTFTYFYYEMIWTVDWRFSLRARLPKPRKTPRRRLARNLPNLAQ